MLVVAELLAAILADPRVGAGLAQMVGLAIAVGREAGIPVALQAGAPAWLVVQLSFTQDMAVLALVVPWLLRLVESNEAHGTWIGRKLRRIEEAAQRHQAWARRWGPLGIFAFMLVPFLPNGPVSAAVLGKSVGIPMPRLLAPIALATLLSILAWTFAYQRILALASSVDPLLPRLVTLGIVAFVVGSLLLAEAREFLRRRKGYGPS